MVGSLEKSVTIIHCIYKEKEGHSVDVGETSKKFR